MGVHAGGAAGGLGGAVAGWAVATSIAQGLAGLVDLKWEFGGSNGYSAENNQATWDKFQNNPELHAQNVTPPTSSAWVTVEDGYTRFDLTKKKVRCWTNLRWCADEYGQNGFHAPHRTFFAEKPSSQTFEYEPFYTLRSNQPATPPTGGNGGDSA